MIEVWKAIPGHEGKYEASDLGRVRSLDRTLVHGNGFVRRMRGRVLRGHARLDGYVEVVLGLGARGRTKHWRIHQLVLAAHVGPCPRGFEACHGDGDRSNNRLDNLRWDTRIANAQDTIAHGRNYELNRTRCPQGHLLQEPNLARGRPGRFCRSCANACCWRSVRPGTTVEEWKAYADRKYAKLMAGDETRIDRGTGRRKYRGLPTRTARAGDALSA